MKYFLAILFVPNALFAWTLSASGLQGWKNHNLTVHWSSTNCSISSSELTQIIDRALAVWNNVPTTDLKLTRAATESSVTVSQFSGGTATDLPIILCDDQFSTNQQVDPDAVPALTHLSTFAPIDYAGVILNTESGTGDNIANFTEDENVIILAHEVGHMLGLGHSSNEKALMYYSLDGKSSAILARDDRDGITYLYPRNEFQGGFFGCSAIHRRSGAPAARNAYLLSLLLLVGLSFGARGLYFAFSRSRE